MTSYIAACQIAVRSSSPRRSRAEPTVLSTRWVTLPSIFWLYKISVSRMEFQWPVYLSRFTPLLRALTASTLESVRTLPLIHVFTPLSCFLYLLSFPINHVFPPLFLLFYLLSFPLFNAFPPISCLFLYLLSFPLNNAFPPLSCFFISSFLSNQPCLSSAFLYILYLLSFSLNSALPPLSCFY